ncbi:phage tail protein [Sphingomonas sp. BT-65]|uniref:phage tail protein n=1 Tax=Sphingomonas sp. BT-65 TaxID=2989821 RepID=UPI0022359EE0|nr:phage tail protein [Sphingomonas sp. BT-65]MCW4463253.1 phage tail protein [Sphingomonas sp. BT-65]
MRTAFVIGLMATSGTAAAGVALTQSDVSGGAKDQCVLAKATPTPSPTPKPSGAGNHIPKATLTARKTGGDDSPKAKPGNTKYGNIVLKRGAGDAAPACPTE